MGLRLFLVFSACVVMLGLSPSVRADSASHRAAVLELCDVMHMERTMQDSMRSMIDLQVQQVPEMARARPQLQKFFEKYLSWPALKEDFVKLYLEAFTEPELRQLITFYKTPTGQKAVQQMPGLMQRGAQIGANRLREHTAELVGLMQSANSKAPAPGATKPATPPPAAPSGALR